MPTYTFKDNESGEIFDKTMKMSEKDIFLEQNSNLEIYIGQAPSVGDAVRLGVRKIDNGFREVLQKVAEKTPGGKGLKDSIR